LAFLKRFQAKLALGLDPRVGTGSHKENAPKQKSVLILAGFNPFRTAVLSALASPERIRYTLAS
jgi:hypothetical protein